MACSKSAQMRAVGGADLAQAAAGARHDRRACGTTPPISISSPRETITSLRARQRVEHQQHRGGVVVHHRGGLGAGEFARAALRHGCRGRRARRSSRSYSRLHGLRHDRLHRVDGLRRQQRASEIGVQHRAGEVEHAPQRGLHGGLQAGLKALRERRRLQRFRGQRDTVQHGLAHFGEQGTDGVDHGGVAILRAQCLHRRHLEHTIDRRQNSGYLRILRLDQGRFRLCVNTDNNLQRFTGLFTSS